VGIGTAIRHRMGRWEIPAAELYRSCFINLDAFADQLSRLAMPQRILEVGCGDGALAQRLVGTYPEAEYLGIDVAASAGRLYRGEPSRAVFRTITSAQLRAENPQPFDMVIMVDVLHHIPPALRAGVLADVAALTAPAGCFVVKEWASDRPFFGKLGYWADHYVTGDKDVDFMTRDQLRALLAQKLPDFEVVASSTVRPWRENVLLLLTRSIA
jgi:SAM-dependent methyltransferase